MDISTTKYQTGILAQVNTRLEYLFKNMPDRDISKINNRQGYYSTGKYQTRILAEVDTRQGY